MTCEHTDECGARYKKLESQVQEYLDHLKAKGHFDRDERFAQYIFEQAVMFIRGENAFVEINRLIDERNEDES